MAPSIFGPALEEMHKNNKRVYGPVAFQEYLTKNNLGNKRTAQFISIDSLNRLSGKLKKAKTMVFRLGSSSGSNHTRFALAKYIDGWVDYFLLDSTIEENTSPSLFIPNVPVRQLYSFQLLPKLTETSSVNLALGSGLISKALKLDEGSSQVVPATGRSTYTFSFKPYSEFVGKWIHGNGQIEIDALFVGKKNGQETLFILEAKTGKNLKSLAKHKLVYPYMALRNKVPEYMQIVPVYLKIWDDKQGKHFVVTECQLNNSDEEIASINSLNIKAVSGELP